MSALLNLDRIDYVDDDLNKAGRGIYAHIKINLNFKWLIWFSFEKDLWFQIIWIFVWIQLNTLIQLLKAMTKDIILLI